jgi:ATP-dependent Lhr-like helicase
VRAYRRLEARGEVRGGRFVAGVAGEQYALPEVIPLLRSAAEESANRPTAANNPVGGRGCRGVSGSAP